MEENKILERHTIGHDVDHANTADCGLITVSIVLRRGAWVGSRA